MIYDFDRTINRKNTGCAKWDANQTIFGREDILPLWVADMDFEAPEAVIKALVNRADHGIFGYSDGMNDSCEALLDWMSVRYGWSIQSEWVKSSPGVVPAINELVRALTEVGDKILIQSPVYPPFFNAIKSHGREVVNNQLVIQDGRYVMDYTDLEEKFADGVKMMILCSPHNPVGRVWEREELERLGQLCLTYNVLIMSDEIHCDLTFEGHRHIPFASLSLELENQSIVCTAPSKTFNLAGLQSSQIIIPNRKLRQAFSEAQTLNGFHGPNLFGLTATEAAYRHGSDWLEQLMKYLQKNVDFLDTFIKSEMPQFNFIPPEGTYLAWLDLRSLGMEPKELHEFLVHKAGVGLNAGYTFGPGGEGFARLNFGCTRSVLEDGLQRIKSATRALV